MQIGNRVGVHYNSYHDRNYVRDAMVLRGRYDGREGFVVAEHHGHGLCYDVRFSDGTIACYEPEELQVLDLAPSKPAVPFDRWSFE